MDAPLGALKAEHPAWQAGHGRQWLVEQCAAKGALVQPWVSYVRHRPDWSASTQAQALRLKGQRAIWWLTSAEGIAQVPALWPEGPDAWRLAATDFVALVTHPRMVAAAQTVGFAQTCISRPATADVLNTLESLH